MTTDHAVIASWKVLVEKKSLDDIPFVDDPEIELFPGETTELPFRMLSEGPGSKKPIVAPGLLDLLRAEGDKPLDVAQPEAEG